MFLLVATVIFCYSLLSNIYSDTTVYAQHDDEKPAFFRNKPCHKCRFHCLHARARRALIDLKLRVLFSLCHSMTDYLKTRLVKLPALESSP